jgi:hypothetical protein
MDNPAAKWDRTAYTYQAQNHIRGVTVRTPWYRYTEREQGRAGSELYAGNSDPAEMRNLAADASPAGILPNKEPSRGAPVVMDYRLLHNRRVGVTKHCLKKI